MRSLRPQTRLVRGARVPVLVDASAVAAIGNRNGAIAATIEKAIIARGPITSAMPHDGSNLRLVRSIATAMPALNQRGRKRIACRMRHVLQVISRALPGRDADFNDWYEQTHVHEVLALPGFVSCERFERAAADPAGRPDHIAVYEVETDNPQALLQSLFAAGATMTMTDSLDVSSAGFEMLSPTGMGRVFAKT